MGPTTPPPLQGPTAKEKKYDRQLRLWAASGQLALENAHVLLLNSSPGIIGVETLKNLILPGIGSFTIVDEELVTERDLGVNFFLTEESLGKPRATESCRFLKELNPEVQGHARHQSVESFVESTQGFDKYSLILLVASSKAYPGRVAEVAASTLIPLFYIHSVGFYSYFSLQLPDTFPVVDTHPDPASTQDLRLLDPWPELIEFVRSKTDNLETLLDHDHGHIPYLLLLLHYLDVWKESHNGKPPADYKEKKEFKALVEKGARTNNAEGGEENFDEAAAAVLKSLNPPSLPNGLRDVFDHEECRSLNARSANFWIIANTICNFYSVNNSLPLPGALPDMKAQSADYIKLQNIYKSKARHDLAKVTSEVRLSEKKLSRTEEIDSKEIEAFCKGAAFVKLIRGQKVPWVGSSSSSGGSTDDAEDAPKKARIQSLGKQELRIEDSLFPLAVVFLAYADAETASPGGKESLTERIQNLIGLAEYEKAAASFDGIVAEMERANGAELHNISALTGGMVAQEAIKVITKQYIPIDNTCVFDGIASRSAVFRI
ncbi:MAG: hypothetical protein Q9167_001589 [Letrouitia subvulpina]